MAGQTLDVINEVISDSDAEIIVAIAPEIISEAVVSSAVSDLIPVVQKSRSEQLDKAIEAIITAFGDLNLIARSWSVDPDEVAAELEVAGEDAEKIALQLLQTYNPK